MSESSVSASDDRVRAPDFSQADYLGRTVTLSDFRGLKSVVLVFNRGFF